MTEDQKKIVNELLSYTPGGVRECDGTDDWEMGFLNDIQGRQKVLTPRQSDTLAKIWAKVFGP